MNEGLYEAWYEHNEVVGLKHAEGMFIVVCSKHVTNPNGYQEYCYQVQDEHGELYRESGNSWFNQTRLTKTHIPSKLSFAELKKSLFGVIDEGDFK